MLLNHGLFTFADDARTAYERMIAGRRSRGALRRAPRAARGGGRRASVPIDLARADAAAARLAPVLRSALAEPSGDADRPWRRMVLEYRVERRDRWRCWRGPTPRALALENPLTPDHVIRTKGPRAGPRRRPAARRRCGAARARRRRASRHFRAAYDAYFEANAARARTPVTKLDATPRVILVPGVGLFAAGRTKHDARIAADIAEHTLRAKALANDVGRYTGARRRRSLRHGVLDARAGEARARRRTRRWRDRWRS